jgi:hypothetical protein
MATNEAGSVQQHYRINVLGMNESLSIEHEQQKRFSLFVELVCSVPSSIESLSISPNTTPIAGQHFTLECHVHGIPEPLIFWHFNK